MGKSPQGRFFVGVGRILYVSWIEGCLFDGHFRLFRKPPRSLTAEGGWDKIFVPNPSLIDHELRIRHDIFAREEKSHQ